MHLQVKTRHLILLIGEPFPNIEMAPDIVLFTSISTRDLSLIRESVSFYFLTDFGLTFTENAKADGNIFLECVFRQKKKLI